MPRGLLFIGGLVVLAGEGHYRRRLRRRDWKRVLTAEGSADALLRARAEKAHTDLDQADLLYGGPSP